ncbi:MAG: hypothetical protein KAW88_04470, partial [Candidatus Cloacimonetes bacterium]|nr:hypothetical protein [Candidatus Cloacimonadota bacterium]
MDFPHYRVILLSQSEVLSAFSSRTFQQLREFRRSTSSRFISQSLPAASRAYLSCLPNEIS